MLRSLLNSYGFCSRLTRLFYIKPRVKSARFPRAEQEFSTKTADFGWFGARTFVDFPVTRVSPGFQKSLPDFRRAWLR